MLWFDAIIIIEQAKNINKKDTQKIKKKINKYFEFIIHFVILFLNQ